MKCKVFGYAADGDARIYNLEEGESLPDGWLSEPYPGFERHERDTAPRAPIAKQASRKSSKGRT
jgi:hypothetical protein